MTRSPASTGIQVLGRVKSGLINSLVATGPYFGRSQVNRVVASVPGDGQLALRPVEAAA